MYYYRIVLIHLQEEVTTWLVYKNPTRINTNDNLTHLYFGRDSKLKLDLTQGKTPVTMVSLLILLLPSINKVKLLTH